MDEEEHSTSEFYYPDEETDPNASFRYDNESQRPRVRMTANNSSVLFSCTQRRRLQLSNF